MRKRVIGALGIAVLVYFIYLMLLITLQYIPIRYDVAFLKVKQDAIVFTHYKVAFFAHVFSTMVVLIIGLSQFIRTLRFRFPNVHKTLGKIYIILILCIGAPSGLIMAFYAKGGWVSQAAFTVLAILWFYTTFIAYLKARKKQWIKHEDFMWRSYALTLTAISLRLFKWAITNTLELPPADTYRIVSWLAIVVNVIAVEVFIRYKNNC